jgi:hypothetical protein
MQKYIKMRNGNYCNFFNSLSPASERICLNCDSCD